MNPSLDMNESLRQAQEQMLAAREELAANQALEAAASDASKVMGGLAGDLDLGLGGLLG